MDQSSVKISCSNCTLKGVCLPNYLESDQIQLLESIIKRSRILHKGDYMHHYGDLVKSLYIVRSGSVKKYIYSNHGRERILGFYFPGELIGLDSIGKEKYMCSAVALETSTYCSFPLTNFEDKCSKIPSLQKMMFNTMGKILSFENKMMLSACNKKAEEKIATLLMSISKRYLRLGYTQNELRLSMSRTDIGNYLGLNSETVSRVFTQLQNNNIISVNYKQITIKDMECLEELSMECCTCYRDHKSTLCKPLMSHIVDGP